jgi:hypothetical protein
MDREAQKSRSFEDADHWDRSQQLAMTPDQRLEIARVLRERVFGRGAPDVRESARER